MKALVKQDTCELGINGPMNAGEQYGGIDADEKYSLKRRGRS